MTAPSLEVEVEMIKRAVAGIGDQLDPDEDWVPVLLMSGEQGRGIIPLGMFFDSEEGKEIVARVVIPEVVREFEPHFVGLVTTAWMVETDRDSDWESEPMPSQHPDRVEIVNLLVITADGEEQFHTAHVIRSESQPRLAPWEMHEGAHVGGRFGDALRDALCD